ncbi:MAG: hypothetical protein AAGC74_06550 [Verrucomicrobiota bacterium]
MIAILLATILPVSNPALSTETSNINFLGGDSLPGAAIEFDAEGFLVWKSDALTNETVRINPASIDSIVLPPSDPHQSEGPVAQVRFQPHFDGFADILKADKLSFDQDNIEIQTWFANNLTLRRTMVQTIEVDQASPSLFKGPGRIADWTEVDGEGSWRIEGRNLIASGSGSIAREFPDLPDKLHISFGLEFENFPYLQMQCFATDAENAIPASGYSLLIQGSYVQLRKRKDGRSVMLPENLPQELPDFDRIEHTVIDVYLDRTNGLFSLYIDGKTVASWKDPEPINGGNWFHFSSSRDRQHTLSNLTLRNWDGRLPETFHSQDSDENLPGEGQQIALQNGDTILGEANAIQNGKLLISTEFADIKIPIERLSSFQVTSEEAHEKPRMWSGDVRAYFVDGGHVTLRLQSLNSEFITGYSQVFGEATFILAAFSRIEFNPYEDDFRISRGHPF